MRFKESLSDETKKKRGKKNETGLNNTRVVRTGHPATSRAVRSFEIVGFVTALLVKISIHKTDLELISQ